MKCKRCGTEGSPGAIFCLNCGMALPKEADEGSSTASKTMVLTPGNKTEEPDADSGKTMVLDAGKKEASAKPAEPKAATSSAGDASTTGATTQFISRESMRAALAELRTGTKEPAPQSSEESKAEKAAPIAAESKVEESKTQVLETAPPSPAAPEKPAVAAKPVEPKPSASTPPKAAVPEPVVPPVKSTAANVGGFAAIRAALGEIETDYASMEQKLTEAEKSCAAWQTAASSAMLQLKAIAMRDTQAQQEMDYEGLAKTINDLVASPRDIELISAVARRAQALKRVIELHQSAMEAIADANKTFDPLLGKG